MVAIAGLFSVAALPAYSVATIDHPLTASAQPEPAQTLKVEEGIPTILTRDSFSATSEEQLIQARLGAARAANNAAYVASGAQELGDDYPWAYEIPEDQGGGLSPLNYYYRQCTDFVAWRLNRDAGSFQAPWRWVWSNLTPGGGNASQWRGAWESNGWTVSNEPVVGAVAWWADNHVAYVKEVLEGGFVIVEEYNWVPNSYSQRTLALSEVDAFLYPPG